MTARKTRLAAFLLARTGLSLSGYAIMAVFGFEAQSDPEPNGSVHEGFLAT